MEMPEQMSELVSESKCSEKAEPPLFSIDDSLLYYKSEGQTDPGMQTGPQLPALLSVGELLTASGNPFLDQNFGPYSFNPASTGILLCTTEYQYHQQFQLPASSPYDNFLKAAGC